MKTLYCYHVPPIDFWVGALSIDAFMAASLRGPDLDLVEVSGLGIDIALLRWHAERSFPRIGWEGDITSGPYIFAMPNLPGLSLGYMLKQSNNGSCFIASLCPLDWLEEDAIHVLAVEYSDDEWEEAAL